MSTLSSIDIKLSSDTISSIQILKALISNGWSIINEGKVLYLPLGDNDDFNWESGILTEADLFEILRQKERAGEIIGVGLTWEDTSIGGTILLFPDAGISFNLTINRRKLFGNITDVNWYLEKVIPCLDTGLMIVQQFVFTQDE